MVFIDGVKYACAACIKGHRSTTCQHSDRLLHEIKKKGRPITQCSHCRELRKTKKIHAKCNCRERRTEEVDDYQPIMGDKTSVAALLNPCQCVTGAECICCRPTEISETPNHCVDNYNTSSSPGISNDNIGGDNSSYIPSIPLFHEQIQPQDCNYGKDINNNNHSTALPPLGELFNSNSDSPNFPVQNEKEVLEYRPNGLEERSGDQSKVLGEQLCHASSDDLIRIIYHPYQSCSSATTDGGCCGSSVSLCRCGTGCRCDGCNLQTHSKTRVTTASSLSFANNCCSSSSTSRVATQPERTIIVDEEGVMLCGCGCDKTDTECLDCVSSLCEEYLLK